MEISRNLFAHHDNERTYGVSSAALRRQVRDDLYERLRRWHEGLPLVFATERKPPPYIILLRLVSYLTYTI